MSSMNRMNSSSYFEVLPTTTLANAPDLDVLIVPGGVGSRAPDLNSTIRFIEERYPKVKYLISVCTGALLLSKAGVLDGRNATTNKRAYTSVVATNDKVNWVPEARWVTDGNIWTTSGVSAGIDGIIAFIKCIYGEEVATSISQYVRLTSDHSFTDASIAAWSTMRMSTRHGTLFTISRLQHLHLGVTHSCIARPKWSIASIAGLERCLELTHEIAYMSSETYLTPFMLPPSMQLCLRSTEDGPFPSRMSSIGSSSTLPPS